MNTLLRRVAAGCVLFVAVALSATATAQDFRVGNASLPDRGTAMSSIDPKTGKWAAPAPAYADSGVAAVVKVFTAPGITDPFAAVAGRPINVSAYGTGTGMSFRLLRSFDDGVTKLPLTVAGQPYAVWTGHVSEQAWVETEAPTGHPVLFYVEMTATTGGSETVRISQ